MVTAAITSIIDEHNAKSTSKFSGNVDIFSFGGKTNEFRAKLTKVLSANVGISIYQINLDDRES